MFASLIEVLCWHLGPQTWSLSKTDWGTEGSKWGKPNYCVVLTVPRPPLHCRDLWCVQYKLLRSGIKDCCCFQTLKISSFKKKKKKSPGASQGWLERGEAPWKLVYVWSGFWGLFFWWESWNNSPVAPQHSISCRDFLSQIVLGQAAWLVVTVPSSQCDCLASNHKLSP